MSDEDWVYCVEPQEMLTLIRLDASMRKLHLFAAASWDYFSPLFSDPVCLRAINLLDRRAESNLPARDRKEMVRALRGAIPAAGASGDGQAHDYHYLVMMLYRELVSTRPAVHSVLATGKRHERLAQRDYQVRLFRDIFKNPFRHIAFDPKWRTADRLGVARAIYDDPAFDRLPILADALLDAGCDDEPILEHCRGPGPHVRGCWVVDLVLGKE
jgi:hypothetical protein